MSRGRWLARVAALTVLASAGLYGGACGPADETQPAPPDDGLEDVIFEGGATDEGLIALLSAEASADPAQGTVFDAPADGAALPSDPPQKFSWHVGGASGARAEPVRLRFAELGALFGPPRAAWAHGAPINGRAYWVVFTTPGNDRVVRVFTTELTYTPDEAAWGRLRSAGGAVTATITNAIFEDNRVAQGGGPYTGTPITFTIAP